MEFIVNLIRVRFEVIMIDDSIRSESTHISTGERANEHPDIAQAHCPLPTQT